MSMPTTRRSYWLELRSCLVLSTKMMKHLKEKKKTIQYEISSDYKRITAKKNQQDIADSLFKYGAKTDAESKAGFTPLHLAAQEGHVDMTNLLLKNKADVNFVNEHGNSALHYATFWNYERIVEDLIDHGALVNIENKYGETPMNKASGHMAKRMHGETLDCSWPRMMD